MNLHVILAGDYDKQGHLRKDELWNSCRVFDINQQNITLVNCTLLPDNPTVEWNVEVVSQLIQNHIEQLDIDLLITFDKDGVSHHKNHQAIYYATASLCLSGLMPSTCRILVLETVNVVRKYLSLFDVLITLALSTNW
jgi:N-acetylglucosaminylphosphatidylinositol deacetylase